MHEWAVFRQLWNICFPCTALPSDWFWLHAVKWPNQSLNLGTPSKGYNLFFTPCKTGVFLHLNISTAIYGTQDCDTAPPPLPHRCRHNLSPLFLPGCFLPLHVLPVAAYVFKRTEFAVNPGVVLLAQAQRRRPTLLPPQLYESKGGGLRIQPSCLPRPLRLLFNTSCRQTSGEAVPVDTWLPKQWAPVRFILNRHVQNCMQRVAFFHSSEVQVSQICIFKWTRDWKHLSPHISFSFCSFNSKTSKKKI